MELGFSFILKGESLCCMRLHTVGWRRAALGRESLMRFWTGRTRRSRSSHRSNRTHNSRRLARLSVMWRGKLLPRVSRRPFQVLNTKMDVNTTPMFTLSLSFFFFFFLLLKAIDFRHVINSRSKQGVRRHHSIHGDTAMAIIIEVAAVVSTTSACSKRLLRLCFFDFIYRYSNKMHASRCHIWSCFSARHGKSRGNSDAGTHRKLIFP